MAMNDVIRQRRKELNLTQETIAEQLGVSIPAVSKWESGTTYPDVAIIPALARVLKTDVNTLLCFKQELSQQEITNVVNKITMVVMTEGIEKAFELADEKIREYPTDMQLTHTLAMTMQGAMMISELTVEQKEIYDTKIDKLYEKVGENGEPDVAAQSNYMLASKALNQGDYEKAQKLIDMLPECRNIDKQMLQARLWMQEEKTCEAAKVYEQKALDGLNKLQLSISNLINIAVKEDDEELARRLVKCGEDMTESFGMWRYNYFIYSFEKACAMKNSKEILSILNSMFENITIPWDVKQSPIGKHLEQKPEQSMMGDKMLRAIITDMQTNSEYDFLRNEPEFEELMKKYSN